MAIKVLLILLLWSTLLWAQPTVGTPCTQSGNFVTTLSFSCTASDVNRFVSVTVTLSPKTNTITGGTYGAGTPSLILSVEHPTESSKLELFGLVNPASGSQTVQINYSDITNTMIGVLPLEGVHQSSPLGTAASATATTTDTSTVNVSSGATERVIDVTAFFSTSSVGLSPGGGQSEHVDFTEGALGTALGMSSEVGSSTTTMSWTFVETVDGSLIIAVPVKSAVVAGRRRIINVSP